MLVSFVFYLRNVTEKFLRKSYKFPCFYGAIYGTLRNMRPQFAGLIFLLYFCIVFQE